MCRRNHLWGCALAAFGAGLLIGIRLESGFFAGCLGLVAVACGILILQKR